MTEAVPARDLYVSALFKGRRSFVEHSCDVWWILSAEHGLVHPDAVLAPCDTTMTSLGTEGRRRWSTRVLRALDAEVHVTDADVVEVHAGAEYREYGLCGELRELGCQIDIPKGWVSASSFGYTPRHR